MTQETCHRIHPGIAVSTIWISWNFRKLQSFPGHVSWHPRMSTGELFSRPAAFGPYIDTIRLSWQPCREGLAIDARRERLVPVINMEGKLEIYVFHLVNNSISP